ncbi:recombinase family protein [Streptomyces fungicidicus]|uniref:recombinase family protein n=1 Tax=Streptomyces fungicidicus TaxID=68203 RepID=UPI00380507F9
MEGGPACRGPASRRGGQADPDRLCPLFDAQQELASQLAPLEPVCKRIFSEKISTRIKTRPELEKALRLAYDITEAAPDQEVILTVHELMRLARNAAELMTLSGQL